MTLRDLASSQAASIRADASVCIIGAGMAGLTLAHSLASRGMDVLLLESGGTGADDSAESLNEIDNVNGRWTGALRSRCRGVGGTSRLWGGRSIPISLAEARPRPNLESDGWPFSLDELEPYTRQVEEILLLDGSSYEADLYRDQTAGDPDFKLRWAKWPAFINCNLAFRLHRQVTVNPKVTIWTNATVSGFAFDGADGRLTSITASHQSQKRITVGARHFVVAAGAIESTRLLLWMQKQDGQGLGNSPVLGRYFQDHINLKAAKIVRHRLKESNELLGYRFVNAIRRSMHLELSEKTQAECSVGSAFAYISMDLDGEGLGTIKKIARDLQKGSVKSSDLIRLSRYGALIARSLIWRHLRQRMYVPASVGLNVEICAEQAPHWDNAITLSQRTDRHGVPLARVNWTPHVDDERTLRVTIERLKTFWSRSGWDSHASLAWLPHVEGSHARLIDSSVDYYHPSGTTRMGNKPSDSVVSGDLASHQVPNLSVLSASVFPRAGSANPTFTLMRMSLRLGDHLAQRLP